MKLLMVQLLFLKMVYPTFCYELKAELKTLLTQVKTLLFIEILQLPEDAFYKDVVLHEKPILLKELK